MSAILFVVAVLVAAWVAFKVTKFVVSGCLKLVFLAVIAAIIAGMGWFLFKGGA